VSAVIKLSSPATREYWEVPVLFEDESLLALDKPAGLLTSPDRYDPLRPNLMKLLHAGIAAHKPWAREWNLSYLSNAHRLDFETSGVILLAKSKPVLSRSQTCSARKNLKKNISPSSAARPRPKRLRWMPRSVRIRSNSA
jgi:23S rRNA-/tRNA-specific pseudouridylate synthase